MILETNNASILDGSVWRVPNRFKGWPNFPMVKNHASSLPSWDGMFPILYVQYGIFASHRKTPTSDSHLLCFVLFSQLLLDEPTNHLDMSSIDALAKAVNEFKGGLVLVSHDMRLISQVAKEIWICDHKTITKYQGDIMNFKMDMRAQMGIDSGPTHKLRGDASVKAGDKPKQAPKEVKKVVPKLEVIRPVVASIPEAKPAPVPAPISAPKVSSTPDDATAVTVSTSASGISADSADKPKRYIPPHLRKKMQEEASN